MRENARGVYPPLLAALGIRQALRAQAARASVDVSMLGIAPPQQRRGRAAVYFSWAREPDDVTTDAKWAR